MERFNEVVSELLNTLAVKPDAAAVLISLAAAVCLSVPLWAAYRLANPGGAYQPRFAATLVALAFLSTILMDLIQSNLALSLGMLGSLSIVRFRTNIRDPRDIGFIFWSMSIGLAAATGSYLIGASGSLVLGVFMVCAGRGSVQAPEDMMLVVRGSSADLSVVGAVVDQGCQRSAVKAKNVLSDSFELVYEVQVPIKDSDALIGQLFELGGIDSVNLLAGEKAA